MLIYYAIILLLLIKSIFIEAGSHCLPLENVYPCFCSNFEDNSTIVICPGLKNPTELAKVTRSLKSLIIDRFVLLNTFVNEDNENDSEKKVNVKNKLTSHGMFPKKWLSELRVRDIEIQNANLNGYFLVEDALDGQTDFLISLVIKHANLSGRLCSACLPASGTIATSTKELKKTPLLMNIDFSFNNIDLAEAASFPPTLRRLTRLILSNNQIARVQENAFSNLPQLQHVDLSHNLLVTISRKAFVMADSKLQTIDLSYNSISFLPPDLFQAMTTLREVKLNNNVLETLPASTWTKVPALVERVDLRGNFLVCNCSMNWMTRQGQTENQKLVANCIFPKSVEFQELRSTLQPILSCNSRF